MKSMTPVIIFLLSVNNAGFGAPQTTAGQITSNLFLRLKKEFGPPTNQFHFDDTVICAIVARDTNTPVFYRQFPQNQTMDLKLLDSSGREVPKTAFGVRMTQPPPTPRSKLEAGKLKPHLNTGHEMWLWFRPSDIFLATNKGIYQIQVQVRLWAQSKTGKPGYEFPALLAKIAADARAHNPKSVFDTNDHFGLVVSQPVGARILKD